MSGKRNQCQLDILELRLGPKADSPIFGMHLGWFCLLGTSYQQRSAFKQVYWQKQARHQLKIFSL